MPSGYTADIKDDTTFREFALRCARGIGALILMRDDPLDAPIPASFEPSDYHRKALEDALSKQAAVAEWTVSQAAADLRENNERALASHKEMCERDADLRKRYERMIGIVEAWTPPTPDHENFKAFMLNQLRESLQWDCHDDRAEVRGYFKGTSAEWLATLKAKAASDVEYHRKHWQQDKEQAAERTAWVNALRDSLNDHEPLAV